MHTFFGSWGQEITICLSIFVSIFAFSKILFFADESSHADGNVKVTSVETATTVVDNDEGSCVTATKTVSNSGTDELVPTAVFTEKESSEDPGGTVIQVDAPPVGSTDHTKESDAESKHSTDHDAENESSPGIKKKKTRAMSAAMQRLTAKKGESPEAARKLISADQRKARADELRKQKVVDQRTKEDERRAAVLERKKRLEDAEKERKEALFKKLTTDSSASKPKSAVIRKRYSASTSNLAQLKKNKTITCEINLDDNSTSAVKTDDQLPARPKSAMHRTKPSSSTSNLHKSKPRSEVNQSTTADPKKPARMSTKPPTSRLSLNPRPATALGFSSSDRRKTLQVLPSKTKAPVKAVAGTSGTSSTKAVSALPPKKVAKTGESKTLKKETKTSPEKTETVKPKVPVQPTKEKKTDKLDTKPKSSNFSKEYNLKTSNL